MNLKSFNELQINNNSINLVNDLIKDEGLYILVAKPKAGKSLLALQLANSIANGIPFLEKETFRSPVFYVSTELNESQLNDRIKKTGYHFENNQFFYSIKSFSNRLDIRNELLIDLAEFADKYNGKLVIIDMLAGINYGTAFDLNSYIEISEKVMDTYRRLISKFHLTFLLIHHINKNGTTLGSTGIDGFVDGIFRLTDKDDGKYLLKIDSRDFPSQEINLTRGDNLEFYVTEEEVEELDFNLNIFLRYVIDKNNVTFTPSKIVSKLKLNISPTKFGILLNNNKKRLEQEGIFITKNKTANARNYTAVFIDPMNNDEN